MGPNCLKELFTFKKEILNRSLRNSSSTIRLSKPKYKQYEKEFHVCMELPYGTLCQKYKRK
jgi:hypothetical protein